MNGDWLTGTAMLGSTVSLRMAAGMFVFRWRSNGAATAAARVGERRFADLVELSSECVWEMDADLRITYISPNLEKVTGKPPDFYLGKTRAEADPAGEQNAACTAVESAMAARRPFRDVMLTSTCRATGKSIRYELSAKPLFGADGRFAGYRGIARDVSRLMALIEKREGAEAVAQQSERRLESLVELSSDWIWEMDESYRFTYVSPKIRDVSGMDPTWYVGRTRYETHAVTDPDSGWPTLNEKMRARQPFRYLPMRTLHRITGKEVHFELSGAPIYDEGGTFRGFRGTGRDVTQQASPARSSTPYSAASPTRSAPTISNPS
jgi:PAS domain S-box-containing protein